MYREYNDQNKYGGSMKPISSDDKFVYLDMLSCGPECCDAVTFYISSNKRRLWESTSLYFGYGKEYDKELDELRKEVIAACEYYGIVPINIEDDCVYDWEGRREL